jgi:hypothetical protein
LKSEIKGSDLSTIEPIVPTIYANTPHAAIILNITYIFSEVVIGMISPYPIVAIVVTAQYTEVAYFSAKVVELP